ncbi:MAG: transcription elongation factor GreA [Candidatus Atribacteria bacterium]|nr:transcription elongation factor GreA [Candidatus Atribacteria bacterium]MCD6349920.1 transcription elongation factor GreA [Candidatus Atribacteria bacterium]
MEKKISDGKVILTRKGYEKLEKELKFLKSVKRKEVAEKIQHALSFGDLSENAEYEEAKNEQAFVEGRILALEEKLQKAIIIDDTEEDVEKVHLGVRVFLKNLNRGTETDYTIVDSVEANPSEKKISFESPLAQALLGKKRGDIVELKVPAGVVKYLVLDIKKREE